MSALILLIAISLALSAGFVWACIISIRGGQFDDLDSPRWRLIFPDSMETVSVKPNFPDEIQTRIPQHDPH